ncbi:MAG: hypothetical protein SO366_02350, partial [Atopobiaceae bacterium]|nr:hypothetical protein [Atopobiaceae bacterium]
MGTTSLELSGVCKLCARRHGLGHIPVLCDSAVLDAKDIEESALDAVDICLLISAPASCRSAASFPLAAMDNT